MSKAIHEIHGVAGLKSGSPNITAAHVTDTSDYVHLNATASGLYFTPDQADMLAGQLMDSARRVRAAQLEIDKP